MTFLQLCVDSGVLEMFLNVFLIIPKAFHEHSVFLNLFLTISTTFLDKMFS